MRGKLPLPDSNNAEMIYIELQDYKTDLSTTMYADLRKNSQLSLLLSIICFRLSNPEGAALQHENPTGFSGRVEKHYPTQDYISILKRLSSAWKVGLEVRVRRARLLMSSREQSRDMRTSSQSAPPAIMSFTFTSADKMYIYLQCYFHYV